MHRIDTSSAQVDKFGAGKNGFTAGNPQTGTPATDLDNDFFDMLQEELAGVVEASGVALDKTKHNQLLTALKALLLSRTSPFADIKADGAAAVATALANLGLIGGIASDVTGRLIGAKKITSSSTYTPTAGTKFWIVEGVAAGASGAGTVSALSGQASAGGGGGAGEEILALITSMPASVAVTIGAGGTGLLGGAGVAGGNTVFGSLFTLKGGLAPVQASSVNPPLYQAPGVGSGHGTVDASVTVLSRKGGDPSTPGLIFTSAYVLTGKGASSKYGTGAGPAGSSSTASAGVGPAADGYGAGGSGGYSTAGGTPGTGGNGAPGLVIVWEYA